MKMLRSSLAAVALAFASAVSAQATETVDPLTAKVDDSAAQRFAELWRETGGKPDAARVQARYLDGAGRAIAVFTPGRIVSAERLAAKIAEQPQLYRDAVERCLPWVAGTNAQLRSAYLGLKGLFPDRPLPQIAVVVGADNSGGTAAKGIQVIGLEVICRMSPTRDAFEQRMRQFFAHETVHTLQEIDSAAAVKSYMVASALSEGVPDYVAKVVTARTPNPARDEWARGREEWIWQQFQADAATVQAGVGADGEMNAEAQAAFTRWFWNAGSAPEGWPDELGYWVGMRIAEAYVAAAADPHAALAALMDLEDPAGVLRDSGYGATFAKAEAGEKIAR